MIASSGTESIAHAFIQFYLPSPANITFRITWNYDSGFFIRGDKIVASDPSPSPKYIVASDEKSKIILQIIDAISKRPHPQNLGLTLVRRRESEYPSRVNT